MISDCNLLGSVELGFVVIFCNDGMLSWRLIFAGRRDGKSQVQVNISINVTLNVVFSLQISVISVELSSFDF